MWYFTWILGVLLACSFGIVNVLWLESNGTLDEDKNYTGHDRRSSERRKNIH